jgi:sec-independent protein translocase protein TatB
MLEVGWSELLVIAIILIVVVGPKDLPKMLRTFGTMMRKARAMAGEFQGQFNDALRDAELDELRKSIQEVRNLNPKNALQEAFNPLRQAGEDVKRELQKSQDDIAAKAASSAAVAAPPAAAPAFTPPQPSAVLDATPPPSLVAVKPPEPKRTAKVAKAADPNPAGKAASKSKDKPVAKPGAKPAAKPAAMPEPKARKSRAKAGAA